MEAKKWLEEKKMGSNSKSDLDYGACTLNSVELPYKMDSLATGSWSIPEEIRKVHSKATKNILQTFPSVRIDLSRFALKHNAAQNSLVAGKTKVDIGNKMQDSNSLTAAKTMDVFVHFGAELSTNHTFREMTEDGSQNEALPYDPAVFGLKQSQDLAEQIIEGGGAASESHHLTIPDFASNEHTGSRSGDRNCSTAKEVTESSGTPNANAFPSLGSSSNHDWRNNSVHAEETCELLSEASIEIPAVNETTSMASGSQNSSSIHHEQSPHEFTKPNGKRSLAGKTGSIVEKEQSRKLMSRYSRKGRGKGK